jgi:hypothetical protein
MSTDYLSPSTEPAPTPPPGPAPLPPSPDGADDDLPAGGPQPPAGGGVVDDPVLADAYALLASALGDLADHATALARSTDVVEDRRRREALARGLGQVARVCLHLQRLCELWSEADAEGVEPPPVVEDDPGDLTCPRCDGPITLARLREVGHCETCDAPRASAVPPIPGEDEEDEPDADIPGVGEGEEEE